MKKKIIIFTVLFFPFFVEADWIRLFSINKGDLYINSKSIERKKSRIFYTQLVDYNNKQSNGVSSFISYSEVECSNLKVRDLNYELFDGRMGEGTNSYNGKPSKKWKKYKEGTSAHLVNKLLCERVYIK